MDNSTACEVIARTDLPIETVRRLTCDRGCSFPGCHHTRLAALVRARKPSAEVREAAGVYCVGIQS